MKVHFLHETIMTTQNKVTIFAIFFLQNIVLSKTIISDVGLNTVQMIENHGYTSETHTITTEDGYILTYHRIPHGRNNRNADKKPVALLMHGLLSSSADYVNMGPKRGLGYILADQGYDVWIANARGNAWCRSHTKYDVVRDAKNFFDFGWHEIGYYDLPAAIDYILNVTGQVSLFYVGYSQGGTVFLVLASTRPEYIGKIKMASLMAPSSFMENISNDILLRLARNAPKIKKYAEVNQIYEIPYVDEFRELAVNLCSIPAVSIACTAIYFSLAGPDPPQFDQNKISVLLTNFPSHAALLQLDHFSQLIHKGGFSQYDYGRERNLLAYGAETPPPYNLSKITAPVAIYYGKNDDLVHRMDVNKLISKLPNVEKNYLVPYDLFNHFDFVVAKDVATLVYAELIRVMKEH